jgi:SNF2 family DNA or RNA helicase
MIRIGSTHDRCFALHLVCTGTIDVRVTQVLAKKMDLVEQVLGRRLKGEDDDVVVNSSDDLTDLFEGLMEDARAASKS